MLDLMDFKKEFVSLCRDALYRSGPIDMEIEERKVSKAQRGELNGLLFRKKGMNCAPTFYVEDFYKSYKAGYPIAELSQTAVESAVNSLELAEELAENTSELFGGLPFAAQSPDGCEAPGCEISEMLADPGLFTVRMLHKSRNKEYLKEIAYRELECGFVLIAEIELDEYRLVITNELLSETGLSADELFDRALKNTAERFPAILQDLGESAMGQPEDCDNLLEGQTGRAPAGAGPGFVLTNTRFFWGAGALFYPGVIGRIHELLDGDFYVLPSSVHELIIIRVEDQDPHQLIDLVRSANRSVVSDNEVLSDDLYICESGVLHRVSYGGTIPPCGDMLC